MLTKEKSRELAAARLGISYEEYCRKRGAGLLWCSTCQRWEPENQFGHDASRYTGKATSCLESKRKVAKQRYDTNEDWNRRKREYQKIYSRKQHLTEVYLNGVARQVRNQAIRYSQVPYSRLSHEDKEDLLSVAKTGFLSFWLAGEERGECLKQARKACAVLLKQMVNNFRYRQAALYRDDLPKVDSGEDWE